MTRMARRAWARATTGMLFLAAILASACSSSHVTGPKDAVAPFVGDWTAVSLVLTSKADPQVSPDLIALGATFTINVQESGQYTAILLYSGQASTEIGTIEVSGQTITLTSSFPSKSTTAGVYAFNGDHLTIDGDTEFDFNLDGTAEPASVHFDLVKK